MDFFRGMTALRRLQMFNLTMLMWSSVPDPDLEISGGGAIIQTLDKGGWSPKRFFGSSGLSLV